MIELWGLKVLYLVVGGLRVSQTEHFSPSDQCEEGEESPIFVCSACVVSSSVRIDGDMSLVFARCRMSPPFCSRRRQL